MILAIQDVVATDVAKDLQTFTEKLRCQCDAFDLACDFCVAGKLKEARLTVIKETAAVKQAVKHAGLECCLLYTSDAADDM
eukprot:7335708-Alexandrium_andersonii.AAC.1